MNGSKSAAPPGTGLRVPGIAWVVIVVVVGVAVGALLGQLMPPAPVGMGPGGHPMPPNGYARPAILAAGLDSTLLLALVFVYVRTYLETRARFALGLVVVLVALFFQTVAGSPSLFGAFGVGPGDVGQFLLAGSLFEAFALSVFLLLSLE